MTQAQHTAQLAAVAAKLAALSYVDAPTIPAGMSIAEYRRTRPQSKRTHRHPTTPRKA